MSVDFTKIFRKNMIAQKTGLTEAMQSAGDSKQKPYESDFAYRRRTESEDIDKRRAAWEADKTPEQIKQIHADELAARDKKIADDKEFLDNSRAKAKAFDVEYEKKRQERRAAFIKRVSGKSESETEPLEESSEGGSFNLSKEDIELITKALRDISDLQPDGWDDHELSEIPALLDKLTGEGEVVESMIKESINSNWVQDAIAAGSFVMPDHGKVTDVKHAITIKSMVVGTGKLNGEVCNFSVDGDVLQVQCGDEDFTVDLKDIDTGKKKNIREE